jgi:hypothetical protein
MLVDDKVRITGNVVVTVGLGDVVVSVVVYDIKQLLVLCCLSLTRPLPVLLDRQRVHLSGLLNLDFALLGP